MGGKDSKPAFLSYEDAVKRGEATYLSAKSICFLDVDNLSSPRA